MTTLLIDADVVVYESCSSVEKEYHWGDDIWSLVSDAKEAKQIVDSKIHSLKKTLETDKVILVFSGMNNWRKEVLATYKAHRKGVRKPLAYAAVKQYVIDVYRSEMIETLEGDDVLGLLATGWKNIDDPIVVSTDKDMLTLPCKHYNPRKPEAGIKVVSEEEADYNHLMQALVGDKADGYAGCPGVGPVTAEKLLKSDEDHWTSVVGAYEKKGLTEEDALVQAQIARILRHGEYDHTTNEVIYWQPKEMSNESV